MKRGRTGEGREQKERKETKKKEEERKGRKEGRIKSDAGPKYDFLNAIFPSERRQSPVN